jgi:hypothetical protein
MCPQWQQHPWNIQMFKLAMIGLTTRHQSMFTTIMALEMHFVTNHMQHCVIIYSL